MNRTQTSRRAKWVALLTCGGFLMQLIPFGCGQSILRLVTPVYLDGTRNFLDAIVTAVAPLVLP